MTLGLSGDENLGVAIVRRALDEPLRIIARNAGAEGSVIVNGVRERGKGSGWDAAVGEYTDLVERGILDPVKVTRSALLNAGSIAGLLLTTETVVVDKPADEEPEAGHDHGGHGHHHH